jgi:hypothetical protein
MALPTTSSFGGVILEVETDTPRDLRRADVRLLAASRSR